jgi:hypothetical protein
MEETVEDVAAGMARATGDFARDIVRQLEGDEVAALMVIVGALIALMARRGLAADAIQAMTVGDIYRYVWTEIAPKGKVAN